jgi:hypothetical protein
MDAQPETAASEEKDSLNWRVLVRWLFIILLLYGLGFGPAVRVMNSNLLNPKVDEALDFFYAPMGWAYEKTPLHKPLGIYLHLWAPKLFDKNGESPTLD